MNRTSEIGPPTLMAAGFPPAVYLPCSSPRFEHSDVSFDLRRISDGRLALLAYSALDRLVRCAGDHQPWLLVLTRNLEEVRLRTGFHVVLLDIEIPQEWRRSKEGQL